MPGVKRFADLPTSPYLYGNLSIVRTADGSADQSHSGDLKICGYPARCLVNIKRFADLPTHPYLYRNLSVMRTADGSADQSHSGNLKTLCLPC